MTTSVTSVSPKQTNRLKQHSKIIAKRFLDEGFESDPDRISTDSEHQASGTSIVGSTHKTQQNVRGPIQVRLYSAAGSNITHNSTPSTVSKSTIKATQANNTDLHRHRLLTMMVAPQITRRELKSYNAQPSHKTISDTLALEKYYKELQQNQQQTQLKQKQQQQQLANTPTSTSKAGLPMSTGSPSMQRLQYQKQRQPLVATATAHQTAHNHRIINGGISGVNNSESSSLRHSRTRPKSPASPNPKTTSIAMNHTQHTTARPMIMPRQTSRSQSVDVINRHRQGGYDPNRTLILIRGSGSSGNTHPSACFINYKTPRTMLVQPNAILTSSKAGDLVAAGGRSPMMSSATFYPAEGNLQVWQSESGDLAYKSSRNHQTYKAPVCWSQSIPRQTKRVTFKL